MIYAMILGFRREPEVERVIIIINVTYLILALENENIGDATKGQTQMDDLRLWHLVRYVPNMNDSGRFAAVTLVELNLEQEEWIPGESSDKTRAENLMSSSP